MGQKKEVYHVQPLTEGKKNIIAALLDEYDIQNTGQEGDRRGTVPTLFT